MAMDWKLLNFLLSSSLLITSCGSSYILEIPTGPKLTHTDTGASSETSGNFSFTKPKDYEFTYIRDPSSKTKFGIAVTSREQLTSGNDLMIPSVFLFDCSTGKGNGNLMKIRPAAEIQEWATKEITEQVMIFCSAHKDSFKHSHW